MSFKIKLLISLFIFVLILGLQNMEPMTVRFLFWKIPEMPKIYLITLSSALGIGMGAIIGWKLKDSNAHD